MKASVHTMRTEIEKTELQCATPGKGTISMTDHFLMLNALFNRNEPSVATNAIKKMFEYQVTETGRLPSSVDSLYILHLTPWARAGNQQRRVHCGGHGSDPGSHDKQHRLLDSRDA